DCLCNVADSPSGAYLVRPVDTQRTGKRDEDVRTAINIRNNFDKQCNKVLIPLVVIIDGDDMYFAPHGSSLLPCNQHPLCPAGVGFLTNDGPQTMDGGRWGKDGPRLSPIVHRPSSIVHRPSSIVHRPSSIVHRPSSSVHRPSSIVHRPSFIVLERGHRPVDFATGCCDPWGRFVCSITLIAYPFSMSLDLMT